MKYLSVCSGIEAASVAWHPLGWEPLAFSEIEPFPRAVLQHHYPDVPLHGDFTVLRDQAWIADADVLVGGTPCQAFSVAGLRNSLADERGNLSLEFVRLADAIDDLRITGGRDPSIVIWENVPGVLSVKDNAFGCFLAGLAGDVAPYVPPRGKWTNAGVVDGPARTVAWRILDAQYFGLAQRRRRVFVVASAREGFDPAAVLLEFEGVRRDTPPRRETGKVAPTIPSRSTAGGGLGTDFDCDGGVITLAHGQGGAEVARERRTTLTCIHEAPIAAIPVTHALRAEGFDASEDGTGRGTPLVPVLSNDPAHAICANEQRTYTNEGKMFQLRNVVGQPVAYSIMPQNSGKDYKAREVEVAQPIMAGGPVGGNQGGDYILQPVAFAQNTRDEVRLQGGDGQIVGALAAEPGMKQTTYVAIPMQEVGKRTGISTDDPRAGIGIGTDGDPMYTLQAGAQHGVAAYAFQPRIARNGRGDMGEVVNALNAQSGETGKGDAAPCVAVFPIDMYNAKRDPEKKDAINRNAVGVGNEGDPSYTLNRVDVHGVAVVGDAAPCVATINHGDSYGTKAETDAIEALRALRRTVGEEAFTVWGFGSLAAFQPAEVLQSALHGCGLRPAAFSRSWMVYCSLSRPQDGAGWLLQSLRETGCAGCPPQGWEPSEQLARELGAYLSKLSQPSASAEGVMRDLWLASEGHGVLRKALSAVQEMGRPTRHQAQSVRAGDQGGRKPSDEEMRGAGMQRPVPRKRLLQQACDADAERNTRSSGPDEARTDAKGMGHTTLQVRRLTATECEFLMGMPRGYTAIPWKKKPAADCPDGPRYKALGNSMAVPVMRWIGQRIAKVLV